MPFEFRPAASATEPEARSRHNQRYSHSPVDRHVESWARPMTPKASKLKGYTGFSLGNKNPKLRSRYVSSPNGFPSCSFRLRLDNAILRVRNIADDFNLNFL